MTLVYQRRRVPEIDPDHDIADELLTKFTADGEVVESFSLYDVLSSSAPPYPLQRVGGPEGGASRILDPFHCNAVRSASRPGLVERSAIYGPGAVLVTCRHQDE